MKQSKVEFGPITPIEDNISVDFCGGQKEKPERPPWEPNHKVILKSRLEF